MTPRSIREFRTGVAALSAVSLGAPPTGYVALLRGEKVTRSGRPRVREATAQVATTGRSPAASRAGALVGLTSLARVLLKRGGQSLLAPAAV
jgi:hypothetical protein